MWFKVDDGFWSHPKTATLSDGAIALWVRAGAYCAQHLTDGFVAAAVMRRPLGGDPVDAGELVDAGLWDVADEGWQFHDWGDYQPTRSDVESRREYERDRKRDRRRNAKGQYAGRDDTSQQVSRRDNRRESHQPVPSRPVPTQIDHSLHTSQSPTTPREPVTDPEEDAPDGFNPWAVTRAVMDHCGVEISQAQASDLARVLVERATTDVSHPTAFLTACIRRDPNGIVRDLQALGGTVAAA